MLDTRGRGSTDPHIVVCVFANGEARIAATSNVDDALRQWSRRHGVFLPVAAFQCDPAAFCGAANILRLPKTASTEWVADLLANAPLELTAQFAVLRHIRRLGPATAAALFDVWVRAVSANN